MGDAKDPGDQQVPLEPPKGSWQKFWAKVLGERLGLGFRV